jgi:hypothetical protein
MKERIATLMCQDSRSIVGVLIWRLKSLLLRWARLKTIDYLAALWLKCRYRLWTVPTRQVPAFTSLLDLDQAARSAHAQYYLDAGTLLGAVRQGAFAGRPSDVDVAFLSREEATAVVESLVPTPRYEVLQALHDRLHLYFRPIPIWGGRIGNPILVDISYEAQCFCIPSRTKPKLSTRLSLRTTADLFRKPFPICPCYKKRLESLYGVGWVTPVGTQYAKRRPRLREYREST